MVPKEKLLFRRDLRELIVGSYRLIYKLVTDDEVHVIAFVNSARDLDAFLKSEDR